MVNLPIGCKCSNLSAHQKKWLSKTARINTDWYIIYRFYDPDFSKPKHIIVKGMNHFKTLPDRQKSTRDILMNEMDKLINKGYNPFKSHSIELEQLPDLGTNNPIKDSISIDNLSSTTPIKDALDFTFKKVAVSVRTKRDLKFMLAEVKKAVDILNLQSYAISKVSP